MGRAHSMWQEQILDVCTSGGADEEALLLEIITALFSERGINGWEAERATDRARYWQTPYGEEAYIVHDTFPEEGVRVRWYRALSSKPDDPRALIEELSQRLKAAGLTVKTLNLSTRLIHEEDWAHAWKAYYHPVPIGKCFLVVPAWEHVPPEIEKGRHVVRLEPGMAFGTGTHASTVLSLLALERYLKQEDDVLDVGTGTGILAIAAAKATKGRVVATDLDPVAIRSAAYNLALNGLAARVHLLEGDLLQALPSEANPFDLIIANILPDVLCQMIPDLHPFMKAHATLIVSGIVTSRLSLIEDTLKAHRFQTIDRLYQEDWVAVVAQKD